jgi:hypothetical protein
MQKGEQAMAKNQATDNTRRNGSFRSQVREGVKGNRASTVHRTQSDAISAAREILFPTEPTSIPHEEIDRAIEAVISRRK